MIEFYYDRIFYIKKLIEFVILVIRKIVISTLLNLFVTYFQEKRKTYFGTLVERASAGDKG